jgi:hypothetical protein
MIGVVLSGLLDDGSRGLAAIADRASVINRRSVLNLVQKWLDHAQLSTAAVYANAVGVEEKDIAAHVGLIGGGVGGGGSTAPWNRKLCHRVSVPA